jgi:hypothetical protein
VEDEQSIARRLYEVIRTMRGARRVAVEEESQDYTAGYFQALDDLLAWLRVELRRESP